MDVDGNGLAAVSSDKMRHSPHTQSQRNDGEFFFLPMNNERYLKNHVAWKHLPSLRLVNDYSPQLNFERISCCSPMDPTPQLFGLTP